MDRWFFMRVVQGVEAVVRAAGYDLLLYNLGDMTGRERFFDRMPLRRKVDGVIVVDVAIQAAEQVQLQELGLVHRGVQLQELRLVHSRDELEVLDGRVPIVRVRDHPERRTLPTAGDSPTSRFPRLTRA